MPDVVAPSDQLPDVAFHATQRSAPGPVSVFGCVRALEWIEQSEVHRCRQQTVRHETVAAQHRVLVRAEMRQPIAQKDFQRRLRLSCGDGEFSRPVAADELHVAVAFPAVQVGPDLLVDVVFLGQPRRRHTQRIVRGCRFTIVGVEVPPPLGGLSTVHQQVEPSSGVAVEVLQFQRAVSLGPLVECFAIGAEAAGGQHVDFWDGRYRAHEPVSGPRGRLADSEPVADLIQCLPIGAGLQEGGLLAEFGRAMTQGGKHQVHLAAMKSAARERRPGFDQQHRLVWVVEKVRPELVGETPTPAISRLFSHRRLLVPPWCAHLPALHCQPESAAALQGSVSKSPCRQRAATLGRTLLVAG
jgi:hypothetical protein